MNKKMGGVLIFDDGYFLSAFYQIKNADLWFVISIFTSNENLYRNNMKYWNLYFVKPEIIGTLEDGPFEDVGSKDYENKNISKYINLE